ncbi:GNAT family N-acetyltransferase [Novosphingobium sp. 1949]|uniref:GNAT family N-acetyltransferase n=1 Tax=Novosphingobium organovorum TaxID=2930092 RepID=A0ABT0BCE5_9SPHN|nr:GNAT family N-acetyltransferase [Novosphingobium organovorum]MCJ2182740.1 GNAT family N-acetyltransferase [Novosphingobium organovorum]
MTLTIRVATVQDLPRLQEIMNAAIGQLQADFLDPAQVESSRAVMGLDRQLIEDATYFVAEIDGQIAGCGGWSRRATLYGGDHSAGLREPRLLDPSSEAARVRAMYTDPAFVRRGIGRALLAHCEAAARAEGFAACELMGTAAGEPLYAIAGYTVLERIEDARGGAPVPLARMRKELVTA